MKSTCLFQHFNTYYIYLELRRKCVNYSGSTSISLLFSGKITIPGKISASAGRSGRDKSFVCSHVCQQFVSSIPGPLLFCVSQAFEFNSVDPKRGPNDCKM